MGFEEKEHVKSYDCLTMWAPKESFWETNSRAGGVSPHYNNLALLDCFRSFLHTPILNLVTLMVIRGRDKFHRSGSCELYIHIGIQQAEAVFSDGNSIYRSASVHLLSIPVSFSRPTRRFPVPATSRFPTFYPFYLDKTVTTLEIEAVLFSLCFQNSKITT
jgi:hypothetical protein